MIIITAKYSDGKKRVIVLKGGDITRYWEDGIEESGEIKAYTKKHMERTADILLGFFRSYEEKEHAKLQEFKVKISDGTERVITPDVRNENEIRSALLEAVEISQSEREAITMESKRAEMESIAKPGDIVQTTKDIEWTDYENRDHYVPSGTEAEVIKVIPELDSWEVRDIRKRSREPVFLVERGEFTTIKRKWEEWVW